MTDRSVVAVSIFHNRASAAPASVASLVAQDHPDLRIVVVDDGSTDGTLDALRTLDDPRLEVRTQANRGFTATLRDTIASTESAYVAIHDAGDISLPGRIAAQVALMSSRPEVGAVGCHVELCDEGGPVRSVMRTQVGPDPTAQLLRANLYSHGEVLFRRSCYDAVGGYRPFFVFAQDRDLWLRMSLVAGMAVVPQPLYRRIRFATGVEGDPRKKLHQSHLSAFAAQCLEMRMRTGEDWVDRYGAHAGIFRGRSPELGRKLWGLALRAAGDDLDEAAWLNALSVRERLTVRNAVLGGALRAAAASAPAAAALRRGVGLRYRLRW